MSILRQGGSYLLVGLLQLLLDWATLVGLSALGMAVVVANIAGRVAGMLLGFWLNGRYTFAAAGERRLGWPRFRRFLLIWLLLTALSTLLVTATASSLGLSRAWLAKPLVEAGLALLSFPLLRRLVYR